jgi:uncharacterized membrane protein
MKSRGHKKLWAGLIVILLAIADRVLPLSLFEVFCACGVVIGVTVWIMKKKRKGRTTFLNAILRVIQVAMCVVWIVFVFVAVEYFYQGKWGVEFLILIGVGIIMVALYLYAKKRFGVIDTIPKYESNKDASMFPWVSALANHKADGNVLNERAVREARRNMSRREKYAITVFPTIVMVILFLILRH